MRYNLKQQEIVASALEQVRGSLEGSQEPYS